MKYAKFTAKISSYQKPDDKIINPTSATYIK